MSYTLAYTGAEIDALLGKIDAIFVAEYGSTIYSEVTAAIAAGNKVIVANAGKVFVYAGTDDNGGYVFTQSGPNAAKPNATYVTLSTGNVWSTATVDLATVQQFYASLMEDTASGSIASFPDGAENVPVTELTADIEPIQDLHGQASPYPPNGGKNKLDVSGMAGTQGGVTFTVNADGTVTTSGTFSSAVYRLITYTIKLTAGETYVVSGAYANKQIRLREYDSDNTLLETTTFSDTGTVTINANTASCDVYLIVSSLTANNTLSLMISTDGGDFAPYSNICPIEGYTGAEIPVTGINVWDEEWESGAFSTTTGEPVANASCIRAKNFCPVKPSTDYMVIKPNGNYGNIYWYDKDKAFISNSIADLSGTTFAVTSPSNAAFFKIVTGRSADPITVYGNNMGLNYPSTDTSYHAYNGQTYSFSWSDDAGTVYEGTATYLGNGRWKITDVTAKAEYDGSSDENWGRSSVDTFWIEQDSMKKLTGYRDAIMCNCLKVVNTHNDVATTDWSIGGYRDANNSYPNQNWIYVKYVGGDDVTSFKTWLSNNPITVIYPLATPLEYIIDGPDPETLLGDNNIWSNTGDISVKYRANTALYIEKKLGGNVQTLSTPRLIGVSPSEGAFDVISGNPINIERVPLSEIKAPELDELTEAPELEPYDEPEAEEPEDLTEEPEAEEEPAEDAEAEPEKAEEPEA